MTAVVRSLEEVTYGLFDIDPAEYYRERFLYQEPYSVDALTLAARSTLDVQKMEYLQDAIRQTGLRGRFKVLEVGCGSGQIGAWVKHAFPDCELHGVDMSADCVRAAKGCGFDEVMAYDVLSGLPYADNSFDFVFSMDFFGHIEFARKDRVISEMHRVTRQGGYGFHGIEAGYCDYQRCNPKDPEDPVRKYVWHEGHIGVESLEAIIERMSPRFEILMAIPWPLRPFASINVVLNCAYWGKEFSEAYRQVDSFNSRVATDIALAYCCREFMKKLMALFGPILTKQAIREKGQGEAMEKLADVLLQGSGFAMLTLRKPGA